MRRLIVTAWVAAQLLGRELGSGQPQNQQEQKTAATSQAQAIGDSW
ncbi:MAG TPA: hypothetical protein VJO16_15780 [Candidatus Acidoferrum sp.]|nr:hypothetical protein [Candidatus Acidoferrum sp.]